MRQGLRYRRKAACEAGNDCDHLACIIERSAGDVCEAIWIVKVCHYSGCLGLDGLLKLLNVSWVMHGSHFFHASQPALAQQPQLQRDIRG